MATGSGSAGEIVVEREIPRTGDMAGFVLGSAARRLSQVEASVNDPDALIMKLLPEPLGGD